MKILTTIDSFKGSATSAQLNAAVITGILAKFPDIQTQNIPIADGGEGVLEVLSFQENAVQETVTTVDLLGRKIEVPYLMLGKKAIIETAKIIGIGLAPVSSETVAKGTSFGLGKVIKTAIQKGAQTVIVSLGGTGISDGGQGFLKSLTITDLSGVTLIGASDVTTVYYGTKGAATVFAAQKGATKQQIDDFNQRDKLFAQEILNRQGIDLQKISGTGAAGGLGGAIVILGGQLVSGFDLISDLLQLEAAVASSDLILTGEGRLDAQSAQGKVVSGVAKLAKKHGKPCVALVGSRSLELGELEQSLTAVFSIQVGPTSLDSAIQTDNTLHNIALTAQNVVSLWHDHGKKRGV
ncbi:MAG: glycerate kinase [Streptococcaceae bacterium]|jgi:glycerate kinase|nr:glycerate kinase [Streptococcaceae bacterium]